MMKTLLESSIHMEQASRAGVAVGLLLLMLILAGCESPSGTPGSRPGGGTPGRSSAASAPGQGAKPFTPGGSRAATPPNALLSQQATTASPPDINPLNSLEKPAEDKKTEAAPDRVNPLAPTAKVEQAGNSVELASSIIAAKANPFLDWLPKPLQVDMVPTSTATAVPVVIPADPFANVTLLGVIYHPKTPMVLLGGGEQTQLLGKGGVLNLEVAQAKVIAIRSNSVDLQLLDGSAQTRTLELPDIIGYQPVGGKTGDSDASSKSLGGASASASPTSAMMPPTMGKGTMLNGSVPAESSGKPGLANLQKLTQPVLSPSTSDLVKGARPNLQEP